VTRFVLLSTQRTGSTWAIDMLNSHPRVVAYAELFMHGGEGGPKWGGETDLVFWRTFLEEHGLPRSSVRRVHLLWRYLGRVYARRPDIDAAGFKLMYSQLRVSRPLVAALVLRRVRVIHLVRRNVLDVLVSRHAAAQRGAHHARGDVAAVRVRVPADDLVARIEEHERSVEAARARFARLRLPWREVAYEDLVAEPEAAFAALFRFLGTDPQAAPSSSLTKLNPTSHEALIENYAEVREALAGTPYASFVR
jgi:LPS sulfotransferase NodH